MKTIHFKTLSSNLSTRNLGTKIRSEIVSNIESGNFLIFDFAGINVISNSFADECFGKLLLNFDLDKIKSLSTFKNIDDNSKRIISFAFKQRLVQITH
uniref:STAS-like domain-containing protein n=1 Tax=Mucilaginibacter sp. CSA2-8R TaxID=3141542 RepID=UPI00406C1782